MQCDSSMDPHRSPLLEYSDTNCPQHIPAAGRPRATAWQQPSPDWMTPLGQAFPGAAALPLTQSMAAREDEKQHHHISQSEQWRTPPPFPPGAGSAAEYKDYSKFWGVLTHV